MTGKPSTAFKTQLRSEGLPPKASGGQELGRLGHAGSVLTEPQVREPANDRQERPIGLARGKW